MKLELESGRSIDEPTSDDILTNIEGEEFAILSIGPDSYIQTCEQRESPWEYELEYRAGCADKHYRATDGPITLDRVIEAFLRYLVGDPTWWSQFEWKRLDLD